MGNGDSSLLVHWLPRRGQQLWLQKSRVPTGRIGIFRVKLVRYRFDVILSMVSSSDDDAIQSGLLHVKKLHICCATHLLGLLCLIQDYRLHAESAKLNETRGTSLS